MPTRRHRLQKRKTQRRRRYIGGQEAPLNNSMSRPVLGPLLTATPQPINNSNVESIVSENLNTDGLNANELEAFLALGEEGAGMNVPNNISVIPNINENAPAGGKRRRKSRKSLRQRR
jgi:hypothetical protein